MRGDEAALANGVEAGFRSFDDDGEGSAGLVRLVVGPVVPAEPGGGLVGQVAGQVDGLVLGVEGGAVGDPGVAVGGSFSDVLDGLGVLAGQAFEDDARVVVGLFRDGILADDGPGVALGQLFEEAFGWSGVDADQDVHPGVGGYVQLGFGIGVHAVLTSWLAVRRGVG